MVVAADRPRDRLRDRPGAGPLAVEAELGSQALEAAQDGAPRMPQLERADDRRHAELALTGERLRVDGKPRLALCCQHLLALRRRQLTQRLERGVEQPPLELPSRPLPVLLEVPRPPGRLVGQRTE